MVRSNNTNRRSVIKAVGAGATIGMVGLAGCSGGDSNGTGNGQESGSWTIGTSGEETATHASGVAMSSVVSENSDQIEMSAQTTEGTTANNRLIDQDQIDIAQSTHNLVWRANQDQGVYSDPPIEKTLCQTFSFMTLDNFFVKRDIPELDGISIVSDLPEGIDISFGPRGTSAYDNVVDGLNILNIDPEESYNVNAMGLGDQADAMNEGRLDVCTVYTANQESLIGWIQQLDAQVNIDVLEWEISAEEANAAEAPVSVTEVSSNVWNQEITHDSFTALPLGYTTVFPSDISDDLVYEYVEILMDNNEEVRSASAVLERHGPDFATEWLQSEGVAVHPGAEQYYRDNDMWEDHLTSLDEFQG